MERQEAMQAALEIVKAQASVRAMSAEEITGMVQSVAAGIQSVADGPQVGYGEATGSEVPALDHKTAIKENAIICLECGRKFKVLTTKHLASHGLTPAEYRAKYGYKKGQALACKSLARDRRKKMKDMRLWERRQKPATAVAQ